MRALGPTWSGILLTAVFLTAANASHASGIDEKAIASAAYEASGRLRANGKAHAALQELDKAVSLDPEEVKYRAARGSLYLFLHVPEMALQDYREWLQIEPRSARAHGEMGIALEMAKSPGPAIEEYSRAIDLDKKAEYYYGRGSSYKAVGELWSALADYREARRLFEAGEKTDRPFSPLIYPQMYVDLSSLCFKLGYISDAIKVYKEASSIFSNFELSFPFNPNAIHIDAQLQIGEPIADFMLGTEKGYSISNRDLIGSNYILFRWEPVLVPTTVRYDWPAGPMDALVLQDDRSIMLDSFDEMSALRVKLISVATKPVGSGPEGQILRRRRRNWPLLELPSGDESWIGKNDYGATYRVLVVDTRGIIRLALLSQNSEEIRDTMLPLLRIMAEEGN